MGQRLLDNPCPNLIVTVVKVVVIIKNNKNWDDGSLGIAVPLILIPPLKCVVNIQFSSSVYSQKKSNFRIYISMYSKANISVTKTYDLL